MKADKKPDQDAHNCLMPEFPLVVLVLIYNLWNSSISANIIVVRYAFIKPIDSVQAFHDACGSGLYYGICKFISQVPGFLSA